MSAGAVGLYYGARLLEAGHDVYFIARTDLAHLQKNGLTVESVDGDMRFDSVKVFGSAQEIGEVDWVLMALKTYALPAVLHVHAQAYAHTHSVTYCGYATWSRRKSVRSRNTMIVGNTMFYNRILSPSGHMTRFVHSARRLPN